MRHEAIWPLSLESGACNALVHCEPASRLDCNLFLGYGDCGGRVAYPFCYVTVEKTAAELAAISHRHSFVLGDISTAQHPNNKLESTQ